MKQKTNQQVKQTPKAINETQFPIPKFGYRSAAVILFVSVATLFFVPQRMSMLGQELNLAATIVSALIIGFTGSLCQHQIELKQGFSKSFYVVGVLISIVIWFLLFVFYYANTII